MVPRKKVKARPEPPPSSSRKTALFHRDLSWSSLLVYQQRFARPSVANPSLSRRCQPCSQVPAMDHPAFVHSKQKKVASIASIARHPSPKAINGLLGTSGGQALCSQPTGRRKRKCMKPNCPRVRVLLWHRPSSSSAFQPFYRMRPSQQPYA